MSVASTGRRTAAASAPGFGEMDGIATPDRSRAPTFADACRPGQPVSASASDWLNSLKPVRSAETASSTS